MTDDVDADALLDRAGFDPEGTVLTRRQAAVLALRERGVPQADIAARFGTTRSNVAGIEASARENVAKANATVEFVEALRSPVTVRIEPGTDLYAVPDRVFDACDEADIRVDATSVDLIRLLDQAAGDAIRGREVRRALAVSVGSDGSVTVRRPRD